jgi:hypothetical protein
MSLILATREYERWLGERTSVVRRDLRAKHEAMAEGAFPLMRATFYRWMHHWQNEAIDDVRRAPQVLAVGDLHVENFGTWRDSEGRLIWGINDFDEAHPLPFTADLVRLAASAHLALAASQLAVTGRESCYAILDGYREGLRKGGRPFVLSERNTWLWRLAVNDLRNPKRFWREQERKCSPPRKPPPPKLVRFVRASLPEESEELRIYHRAAGKGSLGRQRYLFRVEHQGGITTREAKALLPSACAWISGDRAPRIWYDEIVGRAVRARDPFVCTWHDWIIRRLAPDCSKIDLASLPSGWDESKLLWAMGFETANVHLGTPRARKPILDFLEAAPPRWLDRASRLLVAVVEKDWKEWRRG